MLRSIHLAFLFPAVLVVDAQDRIYITDQSSFLVVNPLDCSAELIGDMGLAFGDIAITPNGTVYGISTGDIYRIDTATAALEFIGSSVHSISLVALNDSVLFADLSDTLYAISTVDANTWVVGPLGYSSSGDLAWFGDDLYMSTGNGIIRITLSADQTTVTSAAPLSPPIPGFPGTMSLVSARLSDDRSSLIGFYTDTMICYSPIDGSFMSMCVVQLTGGGVPGAACRKAPPTEYVGCVQPNVGLSEQGAVSPTLTLLNNTLVVNFSSGHPYTYWALVDALGRELTSARVPSSTTFTVDLSRFGPAVYYLQLTSAQSGAVVRFAKTN